MAQRKLAAIMFSDIVGYTSRLKEDEKIAIEMRRKSQRIQKRLIKKFRGRSLKDMESGMLASFSSIMDAVMCALSIQKATKEVEIPMRIGIHQGEVIFEKKDVLGDGVNIASRIQGLAESNEIVITERVFDDIKNKEGLETEFLGEQALKGVAKHVGVYKVTCTNDRLMDFTIDTGELARPLSFGRAPIVVGIMVIALLFLILYYLLPKIINPPSEQEQSVLVFPFYNYLGTDTLDYFVAGMHNALISDIQKVSALNVKCKTTANAVKNSNMSIPEIADELGVNKFVETAVLCIGDSVCLQVKLFDQEENELWIHDFKVEKSQILNLYNMVTKGISDKINVILTPEEERLLTKSRTIDREAYNAFLKSYQYWDDVSFESLIKAREYLNIAIEKDPSWAPLYAGLAEVWIGISQMGYEPPDIAVPKIYENLGKAIELDPDLAKAHYLNALIAYLAEWDWEKSEKEFLKAIAMNPNDAFSRMYYAHLLYILQRPDEATVQAQLAYELDPLNPVILVTYTYALLCADDCEAAMSIAEKNLALDPDNFLANNQLYETAAHCQDYDRAFELYKPDLQTYSQDQLDQDDYEKIDKIFDEQGYFAAYEEILHYYEEAAEKGFIGPGVMAIRYMMGNQQEKAMDYLEEAFEIHDPQMPYIASGGYPFDSLYDNPRFIAILEKMNLPLP